MAYIYVIDGDMGAGKTSSMSLYAAWLKHHFPNTTLWSNYGLKGSKHFGSYKDFLEMANEEYSLALMDEATYTLDSRNFNSKGQVYFTQLLTYLRKLRITTFFTAVRMQTLDSRIRDLIDIYVYVRKRGGYHYYQFYEFGTGRLLKESVIPVAKMKYLLEQLDLYKTWKIVRPTELPEKEIFHTFVEKLDLANERYYAQDSIGGSLRGP